MNNFTCTCGHLKSDHRTNVCLGCWLDPNHHKYFSKRARAAHEFKLDNLKYLEQRYEETIKETR
jgi:hypothetical protein